MKRTINSEQAMKDFGEQLGALLKGGESIELIGDIGAGKTTFTKGLALGMKIDEVIQSPTFTISRVYQAPSGLTLAHYDFYRLSDAGIMADELQETGDDQKTVTVIEWGDVIRDVMPADHLELSIVSPSEDEREITMIAHGAKSEALLEAVI